MKFIPTIAVTTTAISLSLATLSIAPIVAQADKPITAIPMVPMVEELKTMIEQVPATTQEEIAYVSSQASFHHLMDKVYTELPTSITIEGITKERAEIWLNEYETETLPSTQNNLHTLATYVVKTVNGKVALKDQSHRVYSAKQVEIGVQTFAKEFAKGMESFTVNEKIQAIYNYIYTQFTYGASGYYEMKIGNAYNKQMACNGFSRLVYELAFASGVEVKLIEAEDHFYNHVKTEEGTWIILDVTTDILLKQKYGSFGLSMKDYLSYVSQVGFYWATPVSREKAVASTWTDKEKEIFFSSKSPALLYHQEKNSLSISGFFPR